MLPISGASSSAKPGVETAASVHDRQVVQSVELSPVVSAFVDNVAVIVENHPGVMETIATIKNRLGSDGLRWNAVRQLIKGTPAVPRGVGESAGDTRENVAELP